MRRLLLARQRLHERASSSGEKPLRAARGSLQNLYGEIYSRKKILNSVKLIKERGELRQIDSHLQILKVGA